MSHLLQRRTVLAAAMASAFASGGHAAPVRARVDVVTDELFGTPVHDPYRWMENPADPDWLPFLKSQNEATRAALDALPGRAALASRIAALSGETVATARVQVAGPCLFYEQRPAGSNVFKLFVREAGKADRALIDPSSTRTAQGHVSLDWWRPSFDGRWIAYGLSSAGSEASVLHVMNVASGEVLPERIPMTDSASPAWLADGSGFFYHQLTGVRGTPTLYRDSQVRLHKLRTQPEQDPVVMKRGLDAAVAIEPLQWPAIVTVPGSAFALGLVGDIRTEKAVYLTPLAALAEGKPRWRAVAGFDDLVTDVALMGDTLYLQSNRGAPRGRVLRVPAAGPDLARAVEVLPQCAAVVESLHEAADALYVRLMDGGVQRLLRVDREGRVLPIALPFEGAVTRVFASPASEGAHLLLAGWLDPAGIWKVDAQGRVADTGLTPRPPLDLAPYEVQRGFAAARDGTRVPYTLVARKGLARDGANPTLVNAYGAYQISSLPRFNPALLPFLDAGGVYVTAHVRGGGEYGREWHYGGRKATKSNTWRDLIDVCETLVAAKLTAPAKLAISGTSAGGIAVGRAMTERPDLFAAVVTNVGWMNPLRYMAEQNIADIDEWGPIADAESFRVMQAMDSYQALREGTAYPALLAITGATDPRVAPWHVAKFAARVQAASTSGRPALLRVDFEAGHGIGSTRAQADALAADLYAFVLWRCGAKGQTPQAAA